MSECIFCKIVARQLPSKPVYEDDIALVIPDIHPQAPVHFLVIPKQHVEEFTQASDEMFMHLVGIIKKVIMEERIVGYRLVNNGKGAAIIDHLHVHILGGIDKMRKL
jgi:histidine triad (HIT) family protein